MEESMTVFNEVMDYLKIYKIIEQEACGFCCKRMSYAWVG